MGCRSSSESNSAASTVGSATLGVAGSILAALACSSCFAAFIPLLTSIVGLGGVAALAQLRTYNPWLIALSGVAVGYNVYRNLPARPHRGTETKRMRLTGIITFISALLWVGSVAYELFTIASDWRS